jgi:orotate phosphoribosyltransferase
MKQASSISMEVFLYRNEAGKSTACFRYAPVLRGFRHPPLRIQQYVSTALVCTQTNRGAEMEEGESIMKMELVDMLCRKSFQYSKEPKFRLVSGRMSRFYVNCKPTTLHPRGMQLVGHLMFDVLKDFDIVGVGGLTFGADPIAMAASYTSQLKDHPLYAFSIRKTRKDHGIIRWVEGDVHAGDRVAIIDDVATTGGSTVRAVERAREEGLDVVRAVVLVDRQEGGMDNIRAHVEDTVAIVTRDDLLNRWEAITGESG